MNSVEEEIKKSGSKISPNTSQKIMNAVFIFAGLLTLIILIIIIIGYIIVKGLPSLNL